MNTSTQLATVNLNDAVYSVTYVHTNILRFTRGKRAFARSTDNIVWQAYALFAIVLLCGPHDFGCTVCSPVKRYTDTQTRLYTSILRKSSASHHKDETFSQKKHGFIVRIILIKLPSVMKHLSVIFIS